MSFDDVDEIRAVFRDLIGFFADPTVLHYRRREYRRGRDVFINQNCKMYDLGRIDITDDVMIGRNVSIITLGHPIEPSQHSAFVMAKPIVIVRNVWTATGVTIIGTVRVGENSVAAAGSVVSQDVPPNSLSEEIRRASFVRLATVGTSTRGHGKVRLPTAVLYRKQSLQAP